MKGNDRGEGVRDEQMGERYNRDKEDGQELRMSLLDFIFPKM